MEIFEEEVIDTSNVWKFGDVIKITKKKVSNINARSSGQYFLIGQIEGKVKIISLLRGGSLVKLFNYDIPEFKNINDLQGYIQRINRHSSDVEFEITHYDKEDYSLQIVKR